MKKRNMRKLIFPKLPSMQILIYNRVASLSAGILRAQNSAKCFLVAMLLIATTFVSNAQTYVSGDTSVCPGTTDTYTFSGGPWTFSVLGGGTVTATSTNSVTVAWGSTAGSFQIKLDNGAGLISYQRVFVEGNISLACDRLINVSLDGNCQAVITPDNMLEGQPYPESSYSVDVFDQNGNILAGDQVTKVHLGKTLKVSVTHLCSGINCWGYIYIEDKYIPSLICNTLHDTINCGDAYTPEALSINPRFHGRPYPVATGAVVSPDAILGTGHYNVTGHDLCSPIKLNYYDIYLKYNCNTPVYASLYRYWSAEDSVGNKTYCNDTLYFRRGTLDSVVCPPNYDGFTKPYLSIELKEPSVGPFPRGWNALDNGYPSPYDYFNASGVLLWKGTGAPSNISCDHMAVTFRDVYIPVCGASFKIIRNWTVFDWCTGVIKSCNQLIKVVDNEAPVIICPTTVQSVPTDLVSCTGSILAPVPRRLGSYNDGLRPYIITESSSWTYTIEHFIPDDPANCTGNGTFKGQGVITKVNDSTYRVSNLTLGCQWLVYTFTDDCGNSSKCTFDVNVVDNTPPVAVCDEHTVVTLNESGVGQLFAKNVDNGSYDNCSLDSMLIRRMNADSCGVPSDTNFKTAITFCCKDVGIVQTVVFRVKDKGGRYNDCMVRVTVQDKIPPVITRPSNKTVACGTDLSNLTILGRATLTGGCPNLTPSYRDDTISWKCAQGVVNRYWYVNTSSGGQVSCVQIITVQDLSPFNCSKVDTSLIGEKTINGCDASAALTSVTGVPTWPTGACNNVIAGYKDEVFNNVGGYCAKIIRHWKVIDWCTYDVNSGTEDGICNFDQVIYVRNTVAPIISDSSKITKEVCASDVNCAGNIILIGSATSVCTDEADLIWSYSIDLDNNNTIDLRGSGKNASGNYRTGEHKVIWEVRDRCGNVDTESQIFRINDCKDPSPFCKVGLIITVMPSNGMIDVKARDFIESSTNDNCTPFASLKYSFSTNKNDTVRTYTCDSIPNGKSATFSLTVYVWDNSNRNSFCRTTLTIQDNVGNRCQDRFTNGGSVLGLVMATSNNPLKNAQLNISNSSTGTSELMSDGSGSYNFNDLIEGENYDIVPGKNDDLINGVSTADIVYIQKHILGVKLFNSPYQYIAADANNSKTITASDISELRKAILGITSEFKNNQKSWRFVPMSHHFEDPTNPWTPTVWPEMISILNLKGPNMNNDFMAVKIGDLNQNAATNLVTKTQSRSAEKVKFEIEKSNAPVGDVIKVPVYASWNGQLTGFQMSLTYDRANFELFNIEAGTIDIQSANLGWNASGQSVVRMSWNASGSIAATDEPVFYLVGKVMSSQMTLPVKLMFENGFDAEAYNENVEILDIDWRSKELNVAHQEYELFQNQPNPFKHTTAIAFKVPSNESVIISIYSVDGKQIWRKEVLASKGYNELTIPANELTGSGMLYYKMEGKDYVATRKMIFEK